MVQSPVDLRGMDRLRVRLKVSNSPKIFYCQASELSKATRWQTLGRYLSVNRSGRD